MRIFDCHTHIEKSWAGYDLDVAGKNVIFNTIDEYKKYAGQVDAGDSITLIFDISSAEKKSFIFDEIRDPKIKALKIITRDQKIRENGIGDILNALADSGTRKPVIYDAFYYGTELEYQPSLSHVISLARQFPDCSIIVAHAGGHKVLEYFLHLRPLPNIHYDLSFSLQYLHDSSAFTDIVKLIRHTDKKRIMFGSDFFWASARQQYQILSDIFDLLDLSIADREDILFNNAKRIFGT